MKIEATVYDIGMMRPDGSIGVLMHAQTNDDNAVRGVKVGTPATLIVDEPALMPKRIQRKRTRGWKMPAGAIYVGRPTKWGNPYRVGRSYVDINTLEEDCNIDAATAVRFYEEWINKGHENAPTRDEIKRELAGHDLACWCKEGETCHADVLLRIANE